MFTRSTVALTFAAVLLASTASAFQQRHHRRWTSPTELLAKRKQAKSSAGGFGKGGFGSTKARTANSTADPSKVRSVSGHTGSDAANNFDRIRKLYGKDATTDVYVRSPLNDETLFWF
ncbi:hypothetical protein THAOC_22629, partial [Thalassiosira oceanica]